MRPALSFRTPIREDAVARRLRTLTLIAAASLAVHHLRFALVHLTPIAQADESSRHGYLPFLVALVAVFGGAALILLVRAATPGRHRASAARSLRFPMLWLRNSAALVLIYLLQEALESGFAGESVNLWQIFAQHGGWIPLVAAPLLALAAAALERSADRLVELGSSRGLRVPPWPLASLFFWSVDVIEARSHLYAADAPSRAPPLLLHA